jgi:hypothetical protein
VAKNVPLNVVVRDLLTANGAPDTDGPANFWRTVPDPRDLSEFFARTVLGTRVECARCHNHPYDRWTRADYHAFAAAFARRGTIPDPKTGKDVTARPLGVKQTLSANADTRKALADWATGPQNPRLAESLANRLWKELFGRGLVEPVDDMRAGNPAVHPSVLAAVTAEFTRSGYDLRALLRLLTTSRAYQSASTPTAGTRRDERLFSQALLKPLRAQVLADALAQTTGASWNLPDRAIALTDPDIPSATLDVLGRCQREIACTPELESSGGLPAALHLLAGAPLDEMIRQGAGKLVAAYPTDPALTEELYLRAYSRFPSKAERAYAANLLRTGDRRAVTEDLLWALVNSREFHFNH